MRAVLLWTLRFVAPLLMLTAALFVSALCHGPDDLVGFWQMFACMTSGALIAVSLRD